MSFSLFHSCGKKNKLHNTQGEYSDPYTEYLSFRDSIIFTDFNDNLFFKKGLYIDVDGNLLIFRFFLPDNYNESKKYPLVLFFHSAGNRGNDNENQIKGVREVFEKNKYRQEYPSFGFFPQCPETDRWVDTDWTLDSHKIPVNPTLYMSMTMKLLDKLTKKFTIDTQRIYTMGVSMGGFAVWDAISRYTGRFTAAVPVCGGGDENMAGLLNKIPIWVFHGKLDTVVKFSRSENMVNAIKKYGGNPQFTIYETGGHEIWMNALGNSDLFQWMFSQTKK
jgi:predicted peptidase